MENWVKNLNRYFTKDIQMASKHKKRCLLLITWKTEIEATMKYSEKMPEVYTTDNIKCVTMWRNWNSNIASEKSKC